MREILKFNQWKEHEAKPQFVFEDYTVFQKIRRLKDNETFNWAEVVGYGMTNEKWIIFSFDPNLIFVEIRRFISGGNTYVTYVFANDLIKLKG